MSSLRQQTLIINLFISNVLKQMAFNNSFNLWLLLFVPVQKNHNNLELYIGVLKGGIPPIHSHSNYFVEAF